MFAGNNARQGVIGNIVVGIIGAFVASWLLPRLGIRLGTGIIREIVNATLGAVVFLLLLRLVSGVGGWRGRWR